MEDALDGYNATIYTVCFVNKIRRERRERNGADARADLFPFFFLSAYRSVFRRCPRRGKNRRFLRGRISVADLETINHRGREVDLRRVTKFVQRSSPINHSTAETPTAGIYR